MGWECSSIHCLERVEDRRTVVYSVEAFEGFWVGVNAALRIVFSKAIS